MTRVQDPVFQIQSLTSFGSPAAGHALIFPGAGEDGTTRNRVVMLRELAYLPLEAREDPDILGKQWAAVRGLYNGDVDFIYIATGMYQPDHIGLVQFYGTAADHPDVSESLALCRKRMRAVEAVLANYVFSRLQDPGPERLSGLMQRLQNLPSVLALLGHPDPRRARKGLSRDHFMGGADEELASQQGEILMRGLAKLREDFVFLVTAQQVERQILNQALVRMSRVASQYASRQKGAISTGFSMAIPLAAALTSSMQESQAISGTESEAQTTSQGEATAETEAAGHSTATGETVSEGQSTTRGEATGLTQTTGLARSAGHAVTTSEMLGGSETQSAGTTQTQAESETHTQSQSAGEQVGSAHTTTRSESEAQGQITARGSSWIVTAGQSATQSESVTRSESQTQAAGSSSGQSTGVSQSTATQQTSTAGTQTGLDGNLSAGLAGVRVGAGASGSVTSSLAVGETATSGASQTETESQTHSQASATGTATGRTTGQTTSLARAEGESVSQAQSTTHQRGGSEAETASRAVSRQESEAQSRGTSFALAASEARSQGQTWQTGKAETHSQTLTQSAAQSHSTSQSQAETTSSGRATSWQRSESQSRALQQQWSTQQSLQSGHSAGWMTGLGRGFTGGFSSGLIPGLHLGRSWQMEDDTAMRLTAITRGLVSLLDRASLEGGFLTSALLFVGHEGYQAAASLIPQAFHGPDVPTPVLAVQGDETLRSQALLFQPSLIPDPNPFDIDILWTRWSTLLTPGMLAAYTAPNLFEEGVALTFQEKMPPLAFYPELAGETVCGHQISPETGDLTAVPLRLSRPRHFHTVFCGDTGFGKSVAAERLVYDTTRHWQLKSIVLDFGTGWRKMLNAPGLEGHVEIRQLSPGGVRPLCWNPLQIGRNILPEVQWRTFCDVFGQIAQLGQRRQIHELRDALRRVYLAAGVLVDDPDVQKSDTWGVVRFEEEDLVDPIPGTPLAHLTPAQRQRLAVYRSRVVGLPELYRQIEETLQIISRKDLILRTVLEGILFRLHPLVQGAAALQYKATPHSIDINEIVPGDWGVAVLEGGAFLDDFSKAFLLGWAAWHLYHDAVALRLQRAVSEPAHVQIVFEEANKILAGLQRTGEEGGQSVAEQFEAMWRDSRKYGIWLHLVTQTPSAIPPGILSSCNNIFSAQLTNPRDRDLVIAALHRSEKGFVDETWRRFLASLPVARSVVKLGYAFERGEMEPVYVQPPMLDVPEPTDEDIQAHLGPVNLLGDREQEKETVP